MENQEQLIEMDSLTARATDLAMSQTLEQSNSSRFGLAQSDTDQLQLIRAPTWSLADLVQQPHYIATVTLPSTNGVGSRIWTRALSYANIIAPFTKIPFDIFMFSHFDIVFTFDFVSSPQVAGQVMITYDSGTNTMRTTTASASLADVRLPRKLVTMGQNSKQQFTIKWNSAYNATHNSNTQHPLGSSSSVFDFGQIALTILNPIRRNENISNPTCRIWCQMANFQYAGYTPDSQYV